MKNKIAFLGLFAALAIILGYVESLLPVFIGIPGIKLGLTNLVIVFILYLYSWKEALLISVVRILAIGFLFGNLYSILFSLAGGVLSLFVMYFMRKIPGFSVLGVSVAGGVTHNIGQLFVAAFVVTNFKLMYYLPVLLVSGVVTGLLIGMVSGEIWKHVGAYIRKNNREKL
ncbi:MAG: Gx transporter family protein [Lachnospiraceae bacterium]|nr:Gx transporter family protein [Lachnospiraceae bacterium]